MKRQPTGVVYLCYHEVERGAFNIDPALHLKCACLAGQIYKN